MSVRQAIVYGSNGGIGSAITSKFLQNNYNLFLFSKDESKLKANIDRLRQSSPGSLVDGCAVDVCDPQSIESSVRYFQTASRSPISHLILCAGVNRDRLLMKETNSNIEHIIQTNLISSLNICKQYAKLMLKQNQDSSIVLIGKASLSLGLSESPFQNLFLWSFIDENSTFYKKIYFLSFPIEYTGSAIALIGNRGQSTYASSKAALVGLMKSLSKELIGRQIRVNLIMLGYVDTPMLDGLDKNGMSKSVPLGRIGRPDEVANAVHFLCENQMMNAQTLVVDGGLSLVT